VQYASYEHLVFMAGLTKSLESAKIDSKNWIMGHPIFYSPPILLNPDSCSLFTSLSL
jgi:hypothetical protein